MFLWLWISEFYKKKEFKEENSIYSFKPIVKLWSTEQKK